MTKYKKEIKSIYIPAANGKPLLIFWNISFKIHTRTQAPHCQVEPYETGHF